MFKPIVDHSQPKTSTRVSLRLGALLLISFAMEVAYAPTTGSQGLDDGPQSHPVASALELGKPIEREISGGQTLSYQVTLSKDQFVDVNIQRRGIGLTEKLFGPDGKSIARFSAEWRAEVTESVGFIAEATGTYRLDVKAPIRGSVGRYEIKIAEIRAATEQDRLLHEARRLNLQASTLGMAGKYQDAVSLAARALELGEKAQGPEDAFVGY